MSEVRRVVGGRGVTVPCPDVQKTSRRGTEMVAGEDEEVVADEDGIVVPVEWVGVHEASMEPANQFAMSPNPLSGEVILVIGHLAPPLLIGSPEERREQAQAIETVKIRALARYSMTRKVAQQLRDVFVDFFEEHGGQEADDDAE